MGEGRGCRLGRFTAATNFPTSLQALWIAFGPQRTWAGRVHPDPTLGDHSAKTFVASEAQLSTYRPDIDGLRAICIGSVVMFHAGFHDWAGGFVGVDIFFVISGYLITALIARQIAHGTFSLLGFYERRV